MYRIRICAFSQFFQASPHIKQIDPLVHCILIPQRNHYLLIRSKNILINITNHLANHFSVPSSISLCKTFGLAHPCKVYLPPIVCIINQNCIAIRCPSRNSTGRSRSWFIMHSFKNRISDSSRNICYCSCHTIKFVPDLRYRIIHYSPFTVYRPFRY